jgi:hypothetical protein
MSVKSHLLCININMIYAHLIKLIIAYIYIFH